MPIGKDLSLSFTSYGDFIAPAFWGKVEEALKKIQLEVHFGGDPDSFIDHLIYNYDELHLSISRPRREPVRITRGEMTRLVEALEYMFFGYNDQPPREFVAQVMVQHRQTAILELSLKGSELREYIIFPKHGITLREGSELGNAISDLAADSRVYAARRSADGIPRFWTALLPDVGAKRLEGMEKLVSAPS